MYIRFKAYFINVSRLIKVYMPKRKRQQNKQRAKKPKTRPNDNYFWISGFLGLTWLTLRSFLFCFYLIFLGISPSTTINVELFNKVLNLLFYLDTALFINICVSTRVELSLIFSDHHVVLQLPAEAMTVPYTPQRNNHALHNLCFHSAQYSCCPQAQRHIDLDLDCRGKQVSIKLG